MGREKKWLRWDDQSRHALKEFLRVTRNQLLEDACLYARHEGVVTLPHLQKALDKLKRVWRAPPKEKKPPKEKTPPTPEQLEEIEKLQKQIKDNSQWLEEAKAEGHAKNIAAYTKHLRDAQRQLNKLL